MERTQRTKLASTLVLTVVFLAGAVVGVAVDRSAFAAPSADEVTQEDEARPEVADEGEEARRGERDRRPEPRAMYAEVDGLTEEQIDRIERIIGEATERHGELRREKWREQRPLREEWEEIDDRYDARQRAAFDSTVARIKDVMTPEQAVQYDSIRAAVEASRRERRERRESPSGGSSRK